MTDRILEPVEQLSEILFGLIMALTITCAVSVATADRVQVNHIVIAALGCNFAWGIIDAGMYLMARLGERGHNFLIAKGIREAPDPKSAHRIIANGLPAVLASVFGPAHLELIREKINQMSPSDMHPKLTGATLWGRLASVSLLFCLLFRLSSRLLFSKTRDWQCGSPMQSP